MTGNDIISKTFIQKQARPFRFAQKILAPSEFSQVRGMVEPDNMIYTYWACKEAAFKMDRKKGSSRILNPKKYKVELDNNEVIVSSGVQCCTYSGLVEMTEYFIHVVLSENEGQNINKVISIQGVHQHERSIKLYQHISSTLTDGQHVVEKKKGNIPHLIGWDISLSHCGHWGAWSAVKL